MKQPEVTFVMPAYNAARFVGEAIGSVRQQSVTDWRLVVVDDGSTDDTFRIVSEFAREDPRITVLKMERPSGCAYQPRKRAILAAQTEFVSQLDADDWIEPDYLERLFRRLRETNADIIFPIMAEPDGTIITPREQEIVKSVYRGKDCVKLTLDGWRINCAGGLIKKQLFLDAFDRFGDQLTYIYADELLSRQLMLLTPQVAFCDAKYFYRPNEESVTHKKSRKLFEFMISNHLLVDFTGEHFSVDSEEYLLAQRQNFHGIFEAYRLMDKFDFDKESIDFAKELIEQSKKLVNRLLLKGSVSKVYYYILTSPLIPTRNGLRTLDFLKKIETSFRTHTS